MMGSHQTQSIEYDPMISAHPGDMIQYTRSSYYSNDVSQGTDLS